MRKSDTMLQNKNIQLVFFDIDDTLMVKDKKFMPASVPGAIKKLHENGIRVGIASGRARYGVVQEVQDLDADIYVTINGQYVMDKDDNVIYSNPLEMSDIESIVTWCNEKNIQYGMVGANSCSVSEWTPVVEEAITVVYGNVQVDPDFHQKNDVYQIWTFSDEQLEDTIPSEVAKKVNVVRWHPSSCDIFPINGSKANGIQRVLDKYSLTKDEIVVFGDGLNDVEMFKHAGFAVAMGNSHVDLLPYADYITKDIEDHGIEHALIELGLIK